MNDEAVKWLREQIGWWLDYGRQNAARRPITPLRSHEMRDLVARCEAELAILDGCDDQESWLESAREGEPGDPTLSLEWREGFVAALRQVRELVASGYRHREGYAQHWGRN